MSTNVIDSEKPAPATPERQPVKAQPARKSAVAGIVQPNPGFQRRRAV